MDKATIREWIKYGGSEMKPHQGYVEILLFEILPNKFDPKVVVQEFMNIVKKEMILTIVDIDRYIPNVGELIFNDGLETEGIVYGITQSINILKKEMFKLNKKHVETVEKTGENYNHRILKRRKMKRFFERLNKEISKDRLERGKNG